MGSSRQGVLAKLRFAALLSSLWLGLAGLATAHEVSPAIADLSSDGTEITLSIRLNAEALLAGIDLDGLTDTNDTVGAGDYDALRALTDDDLARRLRDGAGPLIERMDLEADGKPVPLSLRDVMVAPSPDVELPRFTTMKLAGQLPADADSVSFGWAREYGDVILRQQGVEDGYTGYLGAGMRSEDIALRGGTTGTGWDAFLQYIPVGFDHILPKGLDHILFVLGLFFFSTALRPLIWQVTAFTAAHSVTLALGAAGIVQIPGHIVEPLIAASIIYVAIENVFTNRLNPWRPAVIFGFGLLHGLGFASVLDAFGLPAGQFVPALLGFNIGVELGQLTVIALAFLAVGAWFGSKTWYRSRIAVPASLAIAAVGAFWVVERAFP